MHGDGRCRTAFRLGTMAIAVALLGMTIGVGSASAAPTTWAVESSPLRTTSYNELDDVACTSATWCIAVGHLPLGTQIDAIGMRWDGHHWRTANPRSRKDSENYLIHVACTGPTFCLAVGWSQSASTAAYTALVEQWNGTRWSILRNLPGTKNGLVRGVACPDATTCFVVGDAFSGVAGPWFARGNGSTLSLVPHSGIQSISDFSCPSATACTAVGGKTADDQMLVQTYDGAHWTSSGAPNPSSISSLDKVTCASPTSCIAIGQYYDWDTGVWPQLLEMWNGVTWAQQPSPLASTESMNDITCPAANDCVAVGSYTPGKYGATLVLTWNGSVWGRQYPPNLGHFSNSLSAVSCPSPTVCTAVGLWKHDRTDQTLAVAGS